MCNMVIMVCNVLLTFVCCVLLAVFLLLMCYGCVIETIVNIVKDLEK